MPRPDAEIVFTGIGCVGPLGGDRETSWRALRAGERAVRALVSDDFRGFADFLPADAVGAPGRLPLGADRHADPVLSFLLAAADEAVADAGFDPREYSTADRRRFGCMVGTSKGGVFAFGEAFAAARGTGPPVAGAWEAFLPHAASAAVAGRFGLGGPVLGPVAACATGLVAVLRAADLLREGACDVVLAGSGDASLHPAVLASFRRLGVTAARRADPAAACRPFNVDRDGFAVGEGAAVFVLERRADAAARRATVRGTFAGGAMLSDPSGLTALDPTGSVLARAVTDALARAGATPAEIGHLNLHGTATRANDAAEAAGLRAALGTAAGRVPAVALKGAIGHLLGAAGSVELAASLLAMRDGVLPPTANLADPDPDCGLAVAATPVPIGRGYGLKTSLGFGGHVATAVIGPP